MKMKYNLKFHSLVALPPHRYSGLRVARSYCIRQPNSSLTGHRTLGVEKKGKEAFGEISLRLHMLFCYLV